MSALGILLGQRLRRDAVQIGLWSVGTAALAGLGYVGVAQSYGTEADRAGLLQAAVANPVILLFRGLPSGPDQGAFVAFLILPYLAMLAALMSTFLAVRHTRAEEETGRAELIAATAAGRLTPLTATAVHGLIANGILTLLTFPSLLVTGLPLAGSLVTAGAAGATGVAFVAVGLVGAQLWRSARGANAFAVVVMLATFLLCGIGNAIGTPSPDLQRVESAWPAWLSPFGWAENTRPFDDDALWPLVLSLVVAGCLAAVAFAVQRVRDVGESIVPQRPGRRSARAGLSTSTALTWRLCRGAIIAWCAGGLVTGTLATSLAAVVASVTTEVPSVAAILRAPAPQGGLDQGIVVIFFTMLGILAACAGVQVVCRTRQEEARGTIEPVLAAAVGRVRLLSDHLIVAGVAIVLVVAAAVAGAALGIAGRQGDWSLMGDVAVTGAGQAVAAAVFAGIAGVLFAAAPRLTIPLSWTLVGVAMIIGLFGPLFGFPDWLVKLSPVGVAPTVTTAGVDVQGLWWLILAVTAGAAAGLTLMRRRELTPA